MRRALAGTAVAAGAAAGAATGQMWLARSLRVLVPDQDYTAGNDTWPFQLVLLAWFAASAALIGAVCAGPVVRQGRWRPLLAVPAGLGALAPLGFAPAWAEGASSVGGDPAYAAAAAIALGGLIGAAVGVTVLLWRGVGRCAVVWTGWVWLNLGLEVARYDPGTWRPYVVPVHPLGLWTPTWPGHRDEVLLAAVLSAAVLAGLLAWWARRRGDRAPLLGALVGPISLVAVHAVVPPLPGGRMDGDHYSLPGDRAAWLFVAMFGLLAGVLLGVRRYWSAAERTGKP